MKMEKISYRILTNQQTAYGRMEVSELMEGYQIDQHAAVRKDGKVWKVDSVQTGFAMGIEAGTRKLAAELYESHKGALAAILEDREKVEAMIKRLQKAVRREDLDRFESVNYCTVNQRKFDKVTRAAEKAGCLVRKADEATYQQGGNANIIGTPEQLMEVKKVMEEEEMNMVNEKAIENTQETEQAAPEINVDALTVENIAHYLPALLMSLARDKHNNALIMSAGIEAGAFSAVEIIGYFTEARMPHFHTIEIWNRMGYQVKKGERARFQARIWKYTEKAVKLTAEDAAAMNAGSMIEGVTYAEGDEIQRGNFIKKDAYFFSLQQVEKIATLPELPEDVKQEVRKGCRWISGNTRPIKEALKAAGFRWSKKNSAWYRREAA